ncbi:long-chain fatty acid--CoA ligase [Conexibacter stalactiti]|uniref:Long-chain fatty acid--CoA ligase n=1 Tax=Conexibacter stalactiti TaxID=1940611 RepID=A0ABU4HQR0_9ACTN|nr:long-chain fatty acid--CoA ligase [Conexibacter stalactiti]MDW5595652.1 long-chain fatty acid--CoA ligase [Conexibacter stalactiti]MEC5036294.1 long-chain fatty acid--CoA ligase [Conexibacter stalactiti]
MGRNLASVLVDTAEKHGDRIAVKLDDVALNYAVIAEGSARIAGMLAAKGFEPGDRVGLMLPNVPFFPPIYYAILRAGGIVVPMNVLLKEREVKYYVEDSGAKLLFGWHDFATEAKPGAEAAGAEFISVGLDFAQQAFAHDPAYGVSEPADDETAVLLYTSGTTGQPKGAELSHANLLANVETTLQTLIQVDENDVILGALPLFHSFGQTCALNVATAAGATLTLLPRFDPVKALEIIERDKVTVFEGVPTMYNALISVPEAKRAEYDLSSLRLCVSGGSALPGEVLKEFDAAFGAKVLEGYGLSETSPVASFNHPDRARKVGSIGTPIRGVEMKVVDDSGNDLPTGEMGEIVIRGHNVMKGYWRKPEATEAAIRGGWFHTGDLAKIDEDGYFFILDRKKDMIIRGGYNVYPREVEEVLYEHPAVAEAAVVGVPDKEWGEEVGAAVALKEGAQVDADELREYVKERVAAYKYPRRVWLVPALPKGPTGKILKRAIEAPAE